MDSQQRSDLSDLFDTRETDYPGVGFPSCNRSLARCLPNINDPNGYYRFLVIPPDSKHYEIKKAVRAKYRQYHPDGWEPNEHLFIKTRWIGLVLLDPELKRTYDSTPEGYKIYDPTDDYAPKRADQIIRKEVVREFPTLYHYLALDGHRESDCDTVQAWYQHLVDVAPLFKYTSTIKIALHSGQEPRWTERARLITIPRSWPPSKMNAFALFSVFIRNPVKY